MPLLKFDKFIENKPNYDTNVQNINKMNRKYS